MNTRCLPISAAQSVVKRYNPIVDPTSLPALPNDNMSITEIAIDTNTSGRTIHFKARINKSPTRPTQRMAVALDAGSSGCQNDNATPIPIPFNGKVIVQHKGYVRMSMFEDTK